MRHFAFITFLLMGLLLAGCGRMQGAAPGELQSDASGAPQSAGSGEVSFSESPAYHSDTSPEDCFLCGSGMENRMPPKWGQNNIALISLNTFEIKPVEINRYDGDQLIEEFAGFVSVVGGQGSDGGFWTGLVVSHDRGYATGPVCFCKDAVLDTGKMADFLCENCLNEILPLHPERCFGVGVIDLATKDVRIFAEDLRGFTLGDFYIGCDLQDGDGDGPRMHISVFYCPIRYEKEA